MSKKSHIYPQDFPPITNISELVKSVVNVEMTLLNRNATLFQKNLCELKFQWVVGNNISIFETLKEFQQVHGDELNKFVENELLSLPEEADPPSSTLEGLALLRKSEQISMDLQNAGFAYFEKNNIYMALRCYTLAACYAPPGSRAEKLCYSNRSACFIKLGSWNECLEDISRFEKIESGGVASALLEKLERRKVKCSEKMIASVNLEPSPPYDLQYAKEFFTIKNESKDIPGAEDFVGIRMDKEKGRCLYNKADATIDPESSSIVNKAFHQRPLSPFSFQTSNCEACLQPLQGGGIPCSSCVFTLYCSEMCAESEYAKLHSKYECKMGPYLHELKLNRNEAMMDSALFILLKLGPLGLLVHLRKSKDSGSPIPGSSSGGVYNRNSKYFEILSNLPLNEDILDDKDLINSCIFAILTTKILDETTDYFSSLPKFDPDLDLSWVKFEFSKLLLRLKLISMMNSCTISRHHSCDPNVMLVHLPGGTTAAVTTRSVLPGEEFVLSYDPHFLTEKYARHEELHIGSGGRVEESPDRISELCLSLACKMWEGR